MHDNQPSVVIWFLSRALWTVTSDLVPQPDNNPSLLEAKEPVNQLPFDSALSPSAADECLITDCRGEERDRKLEGWMGAGGQRDETNTEMINRVSIMTTQRHGKCDESKENLVCRCRKRWCCSQSLVKQLLHEYHLQ